jgi:predicted enzyme related to lactoylglutathione lyase
MTMDLLGDLDGSEPHGSNAGARPTRTHVDRMPSMDGFGRVNGLVIDGADTMALARFWAAVFGTSIESVAGDGHYVDLAANERVPLLRFQRVPERKSVKNRLHLDVEVDDVFVAIDEVERLGGVLVRPVSSEYGWDFAVVADPEGNEFCVISPSEAS